MELREKIADVLARFPCRAEPGSELDALRRLEVAREILAIPEIAEMRVSAQCKRCDQPADLCYNCVNEDITLELRDADR